MYVVSCRRGFDSDQFLARENRYRNYTNPLNHAEFQELNLTDILGVAKDKHVGILVHGYNNEMPNVMKAYWDIVGRMNETKTFGPEGYGLVIGFAWPGFATRPGFFPAVLSARKAGPFLLELINHLRGVAHSVDVQTHSLGARVALTALKDPKKVFVDNLLMSAPAVDHHLLEPEKDFFPVTASCNRCYIYHSKKDPVLGYFYPLGDVSDGIHKALGRKGPRSKSVTESKTKNVYVIDCTDAVRDDHSGYRKTNRYFKHWKTALSGQPMDRYEPLP